MISDVFPNQVDIKMSWHRVKDCCGWSFASQLSCRSWPILAHFEPENPMVQAHSVRTNFGVPCVVLAWRMLMYFGSKDVTTTSMNFPHLPTVQGCQTKNLCAKTIRSLKHLKTPKPKACFLICNVFIWFNRDFSMIVSYFKPLQVTKIYKVMAALLDKRLLKTAWQPNVKACQSEGTGVAPAPCSFNGTAAIGTAKCWTMLNVLVCLTLQCQWALRTPIAMSAFPTQSSSVGFSMAARRQWMAVAVEHHGAPLAPNDASDWICQATVITKKVFAGPSTPAEVRHQSPLRNIAPLRVRSKKCVCVWGDDWVHGVHSRTEGDTTGRRWEAHKAEGVLAQKTTVEEVSMEMLEMPFARISPFSPNLDSHAQRTSSKRWMAPLMRFHDMSLNCGLQHFETWAQWASILTRNAESSHLSTDDHRWLAVLHQENGSGKISFTEFKSKLGKKY